MKFVRLKKRADFLAVSKKAYKVRTPAFTLQICLSEGDKTSETANRVGFTASKKVGNAVIRNRCKRRLRALIPELSSDPQKNKQFFDIVLIAHKTLPDFPYLLLKNDFLSAVKTGMKKTSK
ncbi:MAG: ribonuclease P protein component [Proteobacteria bacterium]|nr:ribonuclease P protein component [Pseudomonadota bacterium]